MGDPMRELAIGVCKEHLENCEIKKGCNQEVLDNCCSKLGVCPFYKAIWFYILVGVGAVTLLVVLLCVFCCVRKRRKNRVEGGTGSNNATNTA
ncbi:unnamed protein product [Caenorhabditis sp. 36 PRJEB53466]|nr:unnamed protein product [Caenorhabditis sp. 36 PRJEB53466]